MDRIGADFDRSVHTMYVRLGANAGPVQLPWGAEADFKGIVDLMEMKAIRYLDDLGKDREVVEIPEELRAEAEAAREHLINEVSNFDDEIAETYLETGDVPV